MPGRWLRGVASNTGTTTSNPDHAGSCLFWFWYFWKVLGYQFIEESVTGGPTRSFQNSSDATAADGAFAGGTLTFTSASNPFVAGDVGKYLVLVDATNPENCGIHEIMVYNGAGSVDIDFYAPAGVYPLSASGISWWLLDDGSQGSVKVPQTPGDWCVLRVNHASYPWEMRLEFIGGSAGGNGYTDGALVQVATEASSWDTGTHAWKSTAPVITDNAGTPIVYKFSGRRHDDTPASRLYGYGTTEGDFLFGMSHCLGSGGQRMLAMQVSLLDPLETSPTRTARERLFISGSRYAANGESNDSNRGITANYDLGVGHVFSEAGFQTLDAYLLSYYSVTTDWFNQNLEINSRSSKRDGVSFMVMQDPSNTYMRFALNGKIPVAHFFLGSTYVLGNMVQFNQNESMHFRDSMVLPWNGLEQS
jgi:hypothetical protein